MKETRYYWVRPNTDILLPTLNLVDGPRDDIAPMLYDDDAGESRQYDESRYLFAVRRRSRSKPLSFVWYDPSVLICSDSDFRKFGDIILPSSRKFIMRTNERNYIAFRPSVFYDLFDFENSIFSVSGSGALFNFKKVKLTRPPEHDPGLFGISWRGENIECVIVSEKFKEIYDSYGMWGLKFSQSYPE